MKKNPYNDIIHLPHPDPVNHPRMSRENRAAQFAPFAALTGYDSAISETARNTEDMVILEENEIDHINDVLFFLQWHPEASVSLHYFLPDTRKEGGSYHIYDGKINKINENEKVLETASGLSISFSNIRKITVT